MELKQRPELRQKVTLSPQVYQGLAVLAMPIAELQQVIEAEMLENPVLEVEEPEADSSDSGENPSSQEGEERSWDDWLEMYNDAESLDVRAPRDPDAVAANAEDYVGETVTLDDHLLAQVHLLDLPDVVARAARFVIGSLDDDGFFTGSLEEIARLARVTLDEAQAGLHAVQSLDPPGVGARDLAEALRIEMDALGLDEPLLYQIIDTYLADVAGNHFRRVARALKVPEDEIRRLVAILRTLNPRPAGAYSGGVAPGYVTPDVTLRRFGDEWLIIPNSDAMPPLRVSPRYRALLHSESTADDDTRRYLKDRIRSAETFIKNVDRRRDTVSRITQIILETQADFFEDGAAPLRPLRLEDVAVEIGVHLSTISRGVTGKFMDTPYGMFELKHFFSGGYRTSAGIDVAATSIKQRIRELVSAEDKRRPLSDQDLAERLADEGVTVARRTVAKYREELRLDPSWARRVR